MPRLSQPPRGPLPYRLLSLLLVFVLLAPSVLAQADAGDQRARYAADFDAFWQFVADEYAYFDEKPVDWPRVRTLYAPAAAEATDDRAFLNVLERAIGELYDAHAGFNTNNRASPRLVPSGTDLWAVWQDGQAVVTEVRAGSAAEQAGIRPGMVVREVAGQPVEEAVRNWHPQALQAPDPAAQDWALRTVLAGTHAGPVQLTAEADGRVSAFTFTPGVQRPEAPLTLDTLRHNLGYIRIHNTLGDHALTAAFDEALTALRHTRGLILDLRDTPGGGNTTVARGLMSRLVEAPQAYQRHERVAEERAYGVRRLWVEYVAPRGPFAYTQPVVVLVGRWTGSMGEGLAIGLDGMQRATVVGGPMARLRGAISGRVLPNTGIGVRIPTERLMHVDGSPREAFLPPVVVPPGPVGTDRVLEHAVELLGPDRP
ncbi:MAG: S41 family peptidase [Bacteroidota bacterium]